MIARTVTLLENFSAKLGLSLPPETKDRSTARLILTEKLSVQFEEDSGGELLWLYVTLLPAADIGSPHPIVEMLGLLFAHHRHSDARLVINSSNGELLLVSRFIVSSLENEMTLVHALEGQAREVIHIAQELLKTT